MNASMRTVIVIGSAILLTGCPFGDEAGPAQDAGPTPTPMQTWTPPTPEPSIPSEPAATAGQDAGPASSHGFGREWELVETWVQDGRWGFQGYPELQKDTRVTASANGFTSHRVYTTKEGTPKADWEFSYHWSMPSRIVERLDPNEPDFTLHVTGTAKRNAQQASGNFIDCARVEARGFLPVPGKGITFEEEWKKLGDGEATTSEGDWKFWIEDGIQDEFPVTFFLCTDTTIAKYKYRLIRDPEPTGSATPAADDAAMIAENEARYREQDEREGAHEFYEPAEGMRRLPGTADPRFFCHDFAWRPPERRLLPPGPEDVGFHNGHVNPDCIVADPEAFGFEEVHDAGALAPGDIVCYINGDDRNHIDHSGLVVSTGDGVLLNSKDVRNSIFEHRLGADGERNFFRDRFGNKGIRFFRRR